MSTVDFPCPECGLLIKAPENFVGRAAQCPKCSTPVTVPAVGEVGGEPEDGPAAAAPAADETGRPVPAPRSSQVVLLAAMAAAVLGALVWAGITYFTHYEVGWVAWGIGGLVGGGAVAVGGRGQGTAVTCAGLALVAILAGKILAVQFIIDGSIRDDLRVSYQEIVGDARAFGQLSAEATDSEIEGFMLQHGYDLEVDEFRARVAPMLEQFARAAPAFEDWAEPYLESFKADLSMLDVVAEDLNFVDALFAFLGVSTAFGMVMKQTRLDAAARRTATRATRRSAGSASG